MLRSPILTVLIPLAVALLAGCDLLARPPAPTTPTPIPATATPSPAPPPPTATSPPPTATPPPATSTTADGYTALATAAVAGTPGSSADLDLIAQAIATTSDLAGYHLVMVGSDTGETLRLEGDYQAPDRVSLAGDIQGGTGLIVIGDQVYSRDAAGNWKLENSSSASPGAAAGFAAGAGPNLFATVARFVDGATQATSLGTEKIGGASLAHLRIPLSSGALTGQGGSTPPGVPPMGYADIWIDPATKYVHRLTIRVDTEAFYDALRNRVPTPAPGIPTPLPRPQIKFEADMTISRHNEPVSITAPVVPATATP